MIMYGLSREISNMYNKDVDVFSTQVGVAFRLDTWHFHLPFSFTHTMINLSS